MRYSKEHKQATHERLVKVASEKFRAQGGDGIAIADLMHELQLTHGGFYRHFASKEDLYAQALATALTEKAEKWRAVAQRAGKTAAVQAIIDDYLSLRHCADVAGGCPLAALSAEVARQPLPVRLTFEQALREYAAEIGPLMPGATEEERCRNGLALFSGMAGALSLARAVADEALRTTILEAARALYTKAYCVESV